MRANLVSTQPFATTFGAKQTRKRPKLGADSYDELLSAANAGGAAFEEQAEAGSTGVAAHEDERTAVREAVFEKGQSKRIWGELYKVGWREGVAAALPPTVPGRSCGAQRFWLVWAAAAAARPMQCSWRVPLTLLRAPPPQVMDSSDVVIQVLDARDPQGTRCRHLEQHLRKNARHKHMLLLLNKCDLVRGWAVVLCGGEVWLRGSARCPYSPAPPRPAPPRPVPRARRAAPAAGGLASDEHRICPYHLMITDRLTCQWNLVSLRPPPAQGAAHCSRAFSGTVGTMVAPPPSSKPPKQLPGPRLGHQALAAPPEPGVPHAGLPRLHVQPLWQGRAAEPAAPAGAPAQRQAVHQRGAGGLPQRRQEQRHQHAALQEGVYLWAEGPGAEGQQLRAVQSVAHRRRAAACSPAPVNNRNQRDSPHHRLPPNRCPCRPRLQVCNVAPIPGETKVWQYITLMKRIFLIDCPGGRADGQCARLVCAGPQAAAARTRGGARGRAA